MKYLLQLYYLKYIITKCQEPNAMNLLRAFFSFNFSKLVT